MENSVISRLENMEMRQKDHIIILRCLDLKAADEELLVPIDEGGPVVTVVTWCPECGVEVKYTLGLLHFSQQGTLLDTSQKNSHKKMMSDLTGDIPSSRA